MRILLFTFCLIFSTQSLTAQNEDFAIDQLKVIGARSDFSTADLNHSRKLMLFIINEARQNETYRADNGCMEDAEGMPSAMPVMLPELKMAGKLNELAQEQAEYMAKNNAAISDKNLASKHGVTGHENVGSNSKLEKFPKKWMVSDVRDTYAHIFDKSVISYNAVGFGIAKGSKGEWFVAAVWSDLGSSDLSSAHLTAGQILGIEPTPGYDYKKGATSSKTASTTTSTKGETSPTKTSASTTTSSTTSKGASTSAPKSSNATKTSASTTTSSTTSKGASTSASKTTSSTRGTSPTRGTSTTKTTTPSRGTSSTATPSTKTSTPKTTSPTKATSTAKTTNPTGATSSTTKPSTGTTTPNTTSTAKNVALGKKVSMSTTTRTSFATNAINGKTDSNSSSGASTSKAAQSWWQIDLGQEYIIEKIVLHNVSDATAEQLSNFTISTSLREFRGNRDERAKVWARERGSVDKMKEFTGKRNARHIRLWLNGDEARQLSISELEIYGTPVSK